MFRRRRVHAAVFMLCGLGVFLFPGRCFAQFPDRIAGEFSLHQVTGEIDGGLGGGIYADYRLLRAPLMLYARTGYGFLQCYPQRDVYASRKYFRHYISLALSLEMRAGRAWYPFIETGGGYVVNRLLNKQSPLSHAVEEESLTNAPAFHIKPGLRINIARRVNITLSGKLMVFSTEKSSRIFWHYNQKRESSVLPMTWKNWQFSFGTVVILP